MQPEHLVMDGRRSGVQQDSHLRLQAKCGLVEDWRKLSILVLPCTRLFLSILVPGVIPSPLYLSISLCVFFPQSSTRSFGLARCLLLRRTTRTSLRCLTSPRWRSFPELSLKMKRGNFSRGGLFIAIDLPPTLSLLLPLSSPPALYFLHSPLPRRLFVMVACTPHLSFNPHLAPLVSPIDTFVTPQATFLHKCPHHVGEPDS